MDEYYKVSPVRFEKTYRRISDLEINLGDYFDHEDEFDNLFKNCGYKYYIIRYNTIIDDDWSYFIDKISKYDSKFKKDNKDYSIPGNIYDGAETFEDIFIALIKIFKNNDLSYDDASSYLYSSSFLINDIKERFDNPFYPNDKYVRYVNLKTIYNMENYFNILCKFIERKYPKKNFGESFYSDITNYNELTDFKSKLSTFTPPMSECINIDKIDVNKSCYVSDLRKTDLSQIIGKLYCKITTNKNGYYLVSLIKFENSYTYHPKIENELRNDVKLHSDFEIKFNECGLDTFIIKKYSIYEINWFYLIISCLSYDSNFNINCTDYSNPGDIYNGAETFEDILLAIVEIFKNKELSKSNIIDILSNVLFVINGIKVRFNNPLYSKDIYSNITDIETIYFMERHFKTLCDLVDEKYPGKGIEYYQEMTEYNEITNFKSNYEQFEIAPKMDCTTVEKLYIKPNGNSTNILEDCYITNIKENENNQKELNGDIYCKKNNSKKYNKYSPIKLLKSEIKSVDLPNDEQEVELDVSLNSKLYYGINDICGTKVTILKKYSDIEGYWTTVMNSLSILDSNDSNINKNIEDFSVPRYLYKGADTFDDIILLSIEKYEKNIDNLTQAQSRILFEAVLGLINAYKDRLSDSYYINNDLIKYVNEETIYHMEIYLKKLCKIHDDEYYRNILGEELTSQIIDYHLDSRSKYFQTKLLYFINKLVFKVNEVEGYMNNGIGVIVMVTKFSLKINYETIDKEASSMEDALDRLAIKIEKLDEEFKSLLEEYLEELEELYEIITKGTSNMNEDIVYNLLTALRSNINGTHDYSENKRTISDANNKLSLEDIFFVESLNIRDIKYYEKIPLNMLQFIFKGIHYNVINNKMYNSSIKLLKDLQNDFEQINNEPENENEIKISLNSRKSIDYYLSLLAEYNEIAATLLIQDNANNDNDISIHPIGFSETMMNKIKYVYTMDFIEAIQKIVRSDRNKFYDYHWFGSNDKQYKWDSDHSTYEYSEDELRRMISRYDIEDFKTRGEIMSLFIESADPESAIILNKAYNTKFLFVRCFSEDMDANDYEDVLYNADMIINPVIHTVNIQPFTEFLYNTFLDFLEIMKDYDYSTRPDYYENEENEFSIAKVYSGCSSFYCVFESMKKCIQNKVYKSDKLQIAMEKAARKLNVSIRGTRFKLAQFVGRDYDNIFESAYDDYEDYTKNAVKFFEANHDIGNEVEIDMKVDSDGKDVIAYELLSAQKSLGKGNHNYSYRELRRFKDKIKIFKRRSISNNGGKTSGGGSPGKPKPKPVKPKPVKPKPCAKGRC